MKEGYFDGEEVIIKGTITRSGGKGDIYSSDESPGKSFDVRDHIATEEVVKETIIQSVVSQAQSMGASGLVAMGSAGAFQANHILDNSHEAFDIARPMVVEFVDTGTITPPETSKYAGELIPTTQSFVGIKVGEARKQAIEEKSEAKAIAQEVKQASEAAKEIMKASEETKAKQIEAEQEKAKAEARAEAVKNLGEEKVKEIEEKLNEPIPNPEPPTPDQQNAIREVFRNLFNRDDDEMEATPI